MKKQHKQILIFFIALWVLMAVILVVFGDVNLALALNGKAAGVLSAIVTIYTDSIYFIVGFIAILALISMFSKKLGKYRRLLLASWLSYVFSAITITSLKIIINRSRPFVQMPSQINTFGHHPSDPSFPSGHSGSSAAVLTPLALKSNSKILSAIYILIHIGMMYTRLYLGVHWFSDVLVGSIIGVLIAYFSLYLLERGYEKNIITQKVEWAIVLICLVVTIALLFV